MSFTCFGEILWDIFPDQRHLGGAPLNVAYYLNQFGNDTQLVSAVGDDELGTEALSMITASGLATNAIDIVADKQTGQVLVSLDEKGSASYKFKMDCAWDYIAVPDSKLIEPNRTFVYGSLAGRSPKTLETLITLLDKYQFRVFDLNLRPPYDDFELVGRLMQKADLVKLNDEELLLLCDVLNIDTPKLSEQLEAVAEKCSAVGVCVTLGADGAALLYNGEFYSHPGYPSIVVDTVGAGDAFLAALINALRKSEHPHQALSEACATGSFVASQAGAQNPIPATKLSDYVEHRI